jgi:glycerophosphoryl diester phosphodiesterase
MAVPKNRPIILAHRGASLEAPENTLAAFKLAINQGADGVELDARLSADGEVVVFHDEFVGRTTNGKGRVNRHSLEELKKLDAGSWFSSDFAGEKIPTLREVFEYFNGRVVINIELTDYLDLFGLLAMKVVQLIQEYQFQNSVIITSFSPFGLLTVRRMLPGSDVGLITFSGSKGIAHRSLAGLMFSPKLIVQHMDGVGQDFINLLHRKNCKIFAWTVDTENSIKNLAQQGVDGIITDKPALAVQTLRSL